MSEQYSTFQAWYKIPLYKYTPRFVSYSHRRLDWILTKWFNFTSAFYQIICFRKYINKYWNLTFFTLSSHLFIKLKERQWRLNGSGNLAVTYKEMKLLALLPQVYPQDFVDFLLRNCLRFLDGIFHKWFVNFDIKEFYDLINSHDEDLKFTFENPSRTF